MSIHLSLSDLDLPAATASLPSTLPGKAPHSRSRPPSSSTRSAVTGGYSGKQLIQAIAADPSRPYRESWTAALEALVQTLPKRPTLDET